MKKLIRLMAVGSMLAAFLCMMLADRVIFLGLTLVFAMSAEYLFNLKT